MYRLILASLIWAASLMGAAADDLSGLARVVPAESRVESRRGGADMVLGLSQGVPFRVYHLDSPPRLVVDFREVDFSLLPYDSMQDGEVVLGLRAGSFRPGWSRLVAELSGPYAPTEIAMRVDPNDGAARLNIGLERIAEEEFSLTTRAADDPEWQALMASPQVQLEDDASFVVAIDPGHGGVDPGALRDGVSEKELMLEVGLALRDLLRRQGIAVIMTRDSDTFVSLPARISIAHAAGADLFISLHADALSSGRARGATVHTLSDEASDAATAQLAEQHDRADILAGIDLSGSDDVVAGVLMDLARQETLPRAQSLAGALIDAMAAAGGPMNRRPWREAGFSVLKAADIPSVLVELGFLSDARDLKNLQDPEWRRRMVAALAEGILAWRAEDLVTRELVRQ